MLSTSLFAQEEVPFTLDDRDRLIRLEAEQKALRTEMDAKFEGVYNQFNSLYWALSLLIGLVIINLGYTIWDRRTAIHPIKEKLKDLEKDKDEIDKKMVEVDKIKAALKEMGESDQKIAEILKRTAMF
jgi:hypothetical protein